MDGAQKKILIVEDEAIIAMAESHMLAGRGYCVATARSGESAIRLLEEGGAPDLILMDIDLGDGMDGTAAAQAILARWRLPIVFLTSHSSREMVERVRGITRYGYVIKSSGDFVMLSTIEMAFDLFEKERLIEEKNRLLQQAEMTAGLGYWVALPGSPRMCLSEGARAILGLAGGSCGFDEFRAAAAPEDADRVSRAFDSLVEDGIPYDLSCRIVRPGEVKRVYLRSTGCVSRGLASGVVQDVSSISGLLFDLHKAKEWQAVTLRSIWDGVISTDVDGRVVELNREAERLTGWSPADAAGRRIEEVFRIVNAVTREAVENPIQKVVDRGHVVGLANHTVLISRGGREWNISDSAAPIRDEAGALLGVVLIFRDVTDEYRANEALRRNAEVFETLFKDAHSPMLLIDPSDGRIVEANRACERFYGWTASEFMGMHVSRINVLEGEEIEKAMAEAGRAEHSEFHFVHRLAGGGTRRVLEACGPVDLGGRRFLLSIVSDETESIAAGERADLLLRDARHRMKNNMQLLSSLVQLQIAEDRNGEAAAALGELQYRLSSMAIVGDLIYRADDQEVVDSKPFLSELVDTLKEGYYPPSVSPYSRIDEVVLGAKFAVSLGLVISELVVNSCKYAFPGGRGGTIGVELVRRGKAGLRLEVWDDGVGIGDRPGDDDGPGSAGMGLTLVKSLVGQESGVMKIDSSPGGTLVLVDFCPPVG